MEHPYCKRRENVPAANRLTLPLGVQLDINKELMSRACGKRRLQTSLFDNVARILATVCFSRNNVLRPSGFRVAVRAAAGIFNGLGLVKPLVYTLLLCLGTLSLAAQESSKAEPLRFDAVVEALDAGPPDDVRRLQAETPAVDTPVAEPSSGDAGASDQGHPSRTGKGASFLMLLRSSGSVGLVLCILSFIAVALAIEHFVTIRRSVLLPPGLADQVLALLSSGQWGQARQLCKNDGSTLGIVLAEGLAECEHGWNEVEKGAETALAEQAGRLSRKVEFLNVIGNIAPMLGLLGTVLGMVVAFRELADSQGFAKAADLAEGIYLALVTTVEGLVVAIPALALYAFFSNRIAALISETALTADRTLQPVKRRLTLSSQPLRGTGNPPSTPSSPPIRPTPER